jgi:cell division protein FtsI (penicillin-binding protein 3)
MLVLVGRAIDLQIISKKFLKHQGDMRQVDDVSVSAYRGMIIDRNGDTLAISTPVESIWINPRELRHAKEDQIRIVEKLLHLPVGKVTELIKDDFHQ